MGALSADRRRVLKILVGTLAGVWSAAAVVLATVFGATPLRSKSPSSEYLIGDRSIYGRRYRSVRLWIPVDDGWHRRVVQKVLYIRADTEGLPVVLSGTCTHLGCMVRWDEDKGEFRCPCHDGRFDSNGKVLSGPPPVGLERLSAEIRGGDVFVRLES